MRNIVCQAIILGMVSSLSSAEYSGSSSSSVSDGYGKASFSSSYNSGYVGEYAGQLSAGKALGELHGYGESQIAPEQGRQYDDAESRYGGGAYRQEDDGGQKFSSTHYDGFDENLDLSKFPLDVEAHHYTGGGSSDLGEEEDDQQKERQEYQSDESEGDGAKQNLPYTPYQQPEKAEQYKGYQEHVPMQIVPYSGYEEAEQQGGQPSKYSGYEYNQLYKAPKEPATSYNTFRSEPSKAPLYNSYDTGVSQAPYNSYESPKGQAYNSYESGDSKIPSYNSYGSEEPSYNSYESPKAPSPSYSPYIAPKPVYSDLYEPSKGPGSGYSSESSNNYESHGEKYQQSHQPASNTADIIQKIKGANLKNFHIGLQKDIMTINHGKGSFSYSSLYRP